ncbi:hemolysin-type calcium-binding repeat family protein [Microcystis aeruginosa TAIHU98]|uniref:Hemolysin-type calcium-binding repeat family protein n=2 Tax=Microcystaceae TaxID=1890449 RepID=L7DYI2_MICAE|nr:hemolysin-type calcium-binding repeat family protein [Microcystis aeruginosa TAIHU98]
MVYEAFKTFTTMPITPLNLLWSQNLLMVQDNKDNFLYENAKTAFSPLWSPNFRSRFKDILFSATWTTNTPYTPIAGNSLGGVNSVAPYTAAVNDTVIRTLDSTEKGLLIHTSQNGFGSVNPNLWEPTDIANTSPFVPINSLNPSAFTFAEALGNASFGNLSLSYFLAEDTFRGISVNLGRISRRPSSSAKVTLVWTGTPSTTDTDANLDVYLQGTTTGTIYTAFNAAWFGGSSFVGTDAVAGGAGVDLITGAGAVEYIEQIYLPSWSISPWDTSFNVFVNGTLGSAPVSTGQDFSIFFTSRPVVGQGHGWGDVHLSTFDGKPYDLQAVGTFIYVKSLTDDFQVQTVQKPWYTGAQVSVNTAFAIRLDGKTFVYDSELAIGQELKVDGATYNLSSGGSALFGNTRIQRSGNQYTFTYAGLDGNFSTAEDNDVVIASDNGSYVDVFVNPSDDRAGSLQGLLGNGDGDSSNDFALRDGTNLGPNPSVQTIHTTFADSWRVGKGESLFQTTTFLTTLTKSTTVSSIDISPIDIIEPTPDPEPVPFPKEFISLETLAKENPDAVANAFAIAREFGIVEGAFLNGAAFDFLVTGDKTFLLGAKQAADLALQSEFQNGNIATLLQSAAPLGSIEGSKWEDLNANGIWDAGEKALAGWTIYIDSVANGTLDPWELSTVTDANGKYSFTNLGPGEYAIREVNQTGWLQTSPSTPYALILKVGEKLTDVNFGNYQLPTITLNPRSQTIVEGLTTSQNAPYTVTLSQASNQTVSVNYATANGTATAGSDYTDTIGTLTFAPNVTSQVINIPILNDSLNEADETFTLTLSSPTNAALGTQTAATTTITDTLTAAVTTTLPANVENLTLTGAAAINGTGNAGNNVITGNTANNLLNGSGGNDTLNGGAGLDTLTGGAGNDVFLFQFSQSTVANPDRITDFAINSDKIDLLSATGGVLPAPAAFSRAANSAATTLTNVVNAVFTDANGALAGNQALGINGAALVQVTTAGIAGNYIIVNDNVAGFQSANDLLVNVTGIIGTLPALGNIPVSNFFV